MAKCFLLKETNKIVFFFLLVFDSWQQRKLIERGKQKDIIPIYSEDKNQSTKMATHIELHIQFSVPDNIT